MTAILNNFLQCPDCGARLDDYPSACTSCGVDLRDREIRSQRVLANSINRKDQTIFFCVSPVKLVLMSFATCGMYNFFWFYKNWTYVNEHTNENINAMEKSFFNVFTLFWLLRQMNYAGMELRGKRMRFPIHVIAGVYAVCCCSYIMTELIKNSSLVLVPAFLTWGAVFTLIPVQKFVNELNNNDPAKINSKLTLLNYACLAITSSLLLICVCLFIYAWTYPVGKSF